MGLWGCDFLLRCDNRKKLRRRRSKNSRLREVEEAFTRTVWWALCTAGRVGLEPAWEQAIGGGDKEFMIWATVNSHSCFCWLHRASPSLAAKNIISDFGIDHLVMSMCRVFSCVVGRGCLLWPVHSLGKTVLAFALLHSVLQGRIFPLF